MCGIVGYVGKRLALPLTIECLTALEYRGYDSAGVAYVEGEKLEVIKRVGKLKNLAQFLKNKIIPASCAIGHTRWATHGIPNEINAHPHTDMEGNLAVVHNGIIENFAALKSELTAKRIEFESETDTEVFAKLLSYNLFGKNVLSNRYYAMHNAMHSTLHNTVKYSKKRVIKALSKTVKQCEGAYAVAVVIKGVDDAIFFAKNKSPLVLGKGKDENFLASDTPAMLNFTQKFYSVADGELGYIEKNKICVFDENLVEKKPKFVNIELRAEQILLGEFKHFMQKEISQGVESVVNTIDRLKAQKSLEKIPAHIFENCDLHITACGTALHAGRVAAHLIESQLGVFVDIDYASEFRYKNPLISSRSVCLFISQSGETADTLSCLELAKERGAVTIAFTNVPASRMEGLADFVVPTSAGPEIAVASTKAYMAQLAALYAFVERLGEIWTKPVSFTTEQVKSAVWKSNSYDCESEISSVVKLINMQNSVYFIGRGLDYLLAMEASLKLKEITYIHSEALPAGELKHGSLALISKDCVVIAILTQSDLIDKTLNNIYELNSRGAKVILFTPFIELEGLVYKLIKLPEVSNILAPFVAMKPLQTLAYLVAVERGVDPDKPRNLAKSVTVE